MNLWKAFWHCRNGHHQMYRDHVRNTMNCHGCGLAVTSEFLEDLANGYRKRNPGTGSPAAPTPSTVQQAFAALRGALGATALTQQSYYALQGNPLGASPRVEEPVPVTEEILAYRGWMLDQDDRGPVLKSVTRDVAWEISMRAHKVPTRSDENPGLYLNAMGILERPGIYAMRELDTNYRQAPVVGEVALSGIVIEGEYGYRAECAVVRSLTLRKIPEDRTIYVPPIISTAAPTAPGKLRWGDPPFRVAQLLAERYQVECELDLESRTDLPAQELTV